MITLERSLARRSASRHCPTLEFHLDNPNKCRQFLARTFRRPTASKVSLQSVTVSLQLLLFTYAANSRPMGPVIALQTVTKGFSRRAAVLLETK